MVNVVVDTNVLFSALNNPDGVCAAALGAVLSRPDEFRICYTCHMMDEYREVLHGRKLTCRVAGETVDELLEVVADAGDEVLSRSIDWIVYPDRDDKYFVEAAIYCDALLLTSNLRDFPFADVRALTPGEFLSWLAARDGGKRR